MMELRLLNIAMNVDGSSNKSGMQGRGWKARTDKREWYGMEAGIEEARKEEARKEEAKRDGKEGWNGNGRGRAAIAKSGMKGEDESQHGKCGWKAVMKPA
ncbi:MAG TPA: hypothetical protein VFP11_04590 [Candidatus Angelobacter sp.]|nr:hypothetical protein [Candidatus Angelobacter sp.]